MGTKGALSAGAAELGVLALNENIDVVIGDAPTVLTRPTASGAESKASVLTMQVVSGTFRVKPGSWDGEGDNEDFPDDPTATSAGTEDEGKAAWYMANGREVVISAPTAITVMGDALDAKLLYFWT